MENDQKELTILRTAAGSAPAVSQYLRLTELGARIVAVDADPLSVGFHFASAAHCVPRVDDPDYVSALMSICESERVDWILPALDEELLKLAKAHEAFDAIGTRVLLSPVEALDICADKLLTYRFFMEHKLLTPSTFTPDEIDARACALAFPQLVKPRHGRGSSGIYLARNEEELRFFCHYVAHPIAQRHISGTEFTIDILADWNSYPLIIAPRQRIAVDSGISYKGMMCWRQDMVDMATRIVSLLGLVGPANIQCILDEEGQLYWIEVNARLAGSSILSVAAGVPLFEGILHMLRGEPMPQFIRPASDLVMLRYWCEKYLSSTEAAFYGWHNPCPMP